MNRAVPTLALFFFLAFAATAQTTNGLSDAEMKGQQLAQQLCEMQPTEDLTNRGVLEIHGPKGYQKEFPITFETVVTGSNWMAIYEKTLPTNETGSSKLTVIHHGSISNQYKMTINFAGQPRLPWTKDRSDIIVKLPFAGDFSAGDLGLEFFHWPEQKVLKHESRRTRACTILESTNPDSSAGGYSRVDSWIDDETLSIVHAEAYDNKGKLLKEFDPKSFKKVNGQWELQDMEIRNVQTGSRTWIKFDLSGKS